jgi:iron complex transport system substrate-binding protein
MFVVHAKEQDSSGAHITRRDFLSAVVTITGGVVMFSLPKQSSAEELSTARNSDFDKTLFMDSLGRSLDIAMPAKSVVPLGIYAQTLMETLYPCAIASLAKEISSDADDYIDAGLADIVVLDETGTPRSNFGKELDLNQIAALAPDVILQAGIMRAGVAEEIERIQSETGISCVFFDISFGKLQESYRALGRLFGCKERAEELVCYIEDAQARAVDIMECDFPKQKVFYGPRVDGKKVNESVKIQVDVMLQLGLEPVTSPYNFDGHNVNFVALASEDPDFIILDDISFQSKFLHCEGDVYKLWNNVRAICDGRFAVAPALMHSILGSAVFVQSIGMLWIAYAVASSTQKIDIATEMVWFYSLFYGLDRNCKYMARLVGVDVKDE